MNVGNIYLIIGRLPAGTEPDKLNPALMDVIKKEKMELLGVVPHDPLIEEIELKGGSFFDLPADSPAILAAGKILESVEQRAESENK